MAQNETPPPIPRGPACTPEALCSMSGNIKVGACDVRSNLVTGRGATPEEAASNFFASRQLLLDGYAALDRPQPPAIPLTREARLAQILTCGLAKAVANGDYSLVERLAKAVALVLSDAVTPTEIAPVFAVRSQKNEYEWYEVSGKVCTCPDSTKHVKAGDIGYYCKHVLAVIFTAKLAE